MEDFDIGKSLKLQGYLSNQDLDNDTMNFIDTLNFRDLLSNEEYMDITNKVNKYRTLENQQKENPTSENSSEMQELAQDILYCTGKPVNSISLGSLKTDNDLMQILYNSNIRSKNDLFVDIDYDDYRSNSDFVKCKLVSHNTPYCYGIQANAKMVITKSGKIITTKNALYSK